MTPIAGASTCPACGAPSARARAEGHLPESACDRCGYVAGESNRCPHCGAIARAERRAFGGRARWVCAVCNGPRIPGNLGGDLALGALRGAKADLGVAARSRAASWVWIVMAAFATLVLVAAWPASLVAKLVLFAFAATPALLAARARARASAAKDSATAAEQRAEVAAAGEIASRAPSGVTAEELAGRLGVDVPRAEKLLGELATQERTRIDVGDDAEVRYSVAPIGGGESFEAERDHDTERDRERARAEVRR